MYVFYGSRNQIIQRLETKNLFLNFINVNRQVYTENIYIHHKCFGFILGGMHTRDMHALEI